MFVFRFISNLFGSSYGFREGNRRAVYLPLLHTNLNRKNGIVEHVMTNGPNVVTNTRPLLSAHEQNIVSLPLEKHHQNEEKSHRALH